MRALLTWLRSTPAARAITAVASVGCGVGMFCCFAAIAVLIATGRPQPWLVGLLVLPWVVVAPATALSIAWATARRSEREDFVTPQLGVRLQRLRARDAFGPATPAPLVAAVFAVMAVGWAVGLGSMVLSGFDHPPATPSCAYRSNDHGVAVCETAAQAAAQQAAPIGILAFFVAFDGGSALGGVLEQRRSARG